MPFVNIRIYEGWGKDRKDEIARRVTDAITDVTKLPKEAVWVVFEEVDPPDWYVGGQARGARSRSDRLDPRPALHAGRRPGSSSRRSPPAASSPRDRSGIPRASTCSGATCRAITCGAGRRRTASRRSASPATSPTGSRGTGRAACSPASTPRARCRAPSPTGASRPSPRTTRASSSTAPTTSSARRDGGIYFSDPPYGRAEFYGVERAAGAGLPGRLSARAPIPKRPTLLVDDFDRPNGLCFSLDGRRLFVNDTARQHIRVFDVKARRRPRRRRGVGGDDGRGKPARPTA